MADGKWITGLTAPVPLVAAAQRVLEARLGLVQTTLPPALDPNNHDPEAIHQLRVATRRAGAAVQLFSLCLPVKTLRRVRCALRTLRRAAGATRDWDVYRDHLRAWHRLGRPPVEQPALDILLGYSLGQRAAARRELLRSGSAQAVGLAALCTKTAERVQAPDAGPDLLVDLAVNRLQTQFDELTAAVAALTDSYDALHAIRILGKQLRYAQEIFADLFAPPFKLLLYPAIEQMQSILGNANDAFVALHHTQAILAELRTLDPLAAERADPGVAAWSAAQSTTMATARADFLAWWPAWQALTTAYPLRGLLGIT
jgi:CHAD domain-containing protein